MKKVTVTFSIPEELNDHLHSVVEKRGLSKFVSAAIEQALKEEEETLKKAYLEAEKESSRQEVVDDWAQLDGEDWDGQ